MHWQVKYWTKKKDFRISNIHIVSLPNGIKWIYCELGTREATIQCHGGSIPPEGKLGNQSVMFGAGKYTAELILYPDCKNEDRMNWFDYISKNSYEAVLIPHKLMSKSWDQYCKERSRNAKSKAARNT